MQKLSPKILDLAIVYFAQFYAVYPQKERPTLYASVIPNPQQESLRPSKKVYHGITHAVMVMNLVRKLFTELYEPYIPSFSVTVRKIISTFGCPDSESWLILLQLAGLAHDSGRDAGGKDTAESEARSGQNLKNFLLLANSLINSGIPEPLMDLLAMIVQHKDNKRLDPKDSDERNGAFFLSAPVQQLQGFSVNEKLMLFMPVREADLIQILRVMGFKPAEQASVGGEDYSKHRVFEVGMMTFWKIDGIKEQAAANQTIARLLIEEFVAISQYAMLWREAVPVKLRQQVVIQDLTRIQQQANLKLQDCHQRRLANLSNMCAIYGNLEKQAELQQPEYLTKRTGGSGFDFSGYIQSPNAGFSIMPSSETLILRAQGFALGEDYLDMNMQRAWHDLQFTNLLIDNGYSTQWLNQVRCPQDVIHYLQRNFKYLEATV